MANIRENKKNGKVVSYRFTVCIERDACGKPIRRYTTWTPSEGLTSSKARKAAERAADLWEEKVKAEYQREKEAVLNGRAYMLPPEKRRGDFTAFVQDVWFPMQVQGGNNKPTIIAFYRNMIKTITGYFKRYRLTEDQFSGYSKIPDLSSHRLRLARCRC